MIILLWHWAVYDLLQPQFYSLFNSSIKMVFACVFLVCWHSFFFVRMFSSEIS